MSSQVVDHLGRPRVAVTGIGLKTPAGTDVATFWDTVLAGRPTAGRLPDAGLGPPVRGTL